MGLLRSWRMGSKRRRLYIRAIRKRRELKAHNVDRDLIRSSRVVIICVLRNEFVRLPYFLEYYRKLGVEHFLFVDNDSTDGSREYLSRQPDCSVWMTKASYNKSRFGVDWVNWLARRYCLGRWVLCVDADEFFVYPFCDTRGIGALTDWLDSSDIRSFGAMILDMYPQAAMSSQPYQAGDNPFRVAEWFDPGNYTMTRNWQYGSLWIQGGPRGRVFFRDSPREAPALNKVPLVKWGRGNVFVSSTHMMLPRGLNLVFDDIGGEKACGVLLHAKFIHTIADRAAEEAQRREHYRAGREYVAYTEGLQAGQSLWCPQSERYINWRQLELLGLMSKGNWA
ncbi:glycosyltransferase family 2 protein [Palleronia caenipelagi]|uniref:Glycosyltransferase family 2 protein n=1 Tax=Palleronia caenipelagi TaxID=2489174 RepID=A0A547Q8C9_9RHOB|nr:glycosyltransferase family 2 protein [Palleronia caenipelagi]TRD22636.1 glycosyltransferase family 2 protein [Palleronia caenipelagi]